MILNLGSSKLNSSLKWGLVIVTIVFASIIFKNPGMMSLNWTFPYFSGAANLDWTLVWKISPLDYETVSKMTTEEVYAHRFIVSDDTINNSVNNYGYLLVVWLATKLFFWLGDVQAVIVLQVIVHIIISVILLKQFLTSSLQCWLFFLFYAVNPIVLHFVTFPFYYFWTVIPSFILAVSWLRVDLIRKNMWLVTPLLLFSVLTRPSILFVVIFVYIVTIFRSATKDERIIFVKWGTIALAGLFMIYYISTKMSPVHSVYIGIGAYNNQFQINRLSDEEGYKYYQKVTNNKVSTNAINGSFRNSEFRNEYYSVLMDRYVEIFNENSTLLAKNGLLNTIQAFGPGYDVDRAWSRPFTIAIGCLVITLFIYTKQWFWLLGVLSYALAFTPYFPPIPAYLFGAYILLVLGMANTIELIYKQVLERR
jgi:hypothetical protein